MADTARLNDRTRGMPDNPRQYRAANDAVDDRLGLIIGGMSRDQIPSPHLLGDLQQKIISGASHCRLGVVTARGGGPPGNTAHAELPTQRFYKILVRVRFKAAQAVIEMGRDHDSGSVASRRDQAAQ